MWDDDDEAPSIRQCIDCRAIAPRTDTNYTLISSKYGWRLTRKTDAAGGLIIEWRCPTCWEKYKAGRPPPSSPTSSPGSTPPSSRRPQDAQPPPSSSRKLDSGPPLSRRETPGPPPSRRIPPPPSDPPPGPPPSRRLR